MPVATAINLLLALIDRAGAISSLIQTATASGKTDLTAEDWATIVASDDAARKALADALQTAEDAALAASLKNPGA